MSSAATIADALSMNAVGESSDTAEYLTIAGCALHSAPSMITPNRLPLEFETPASL